MTAKSPLEAMEADAKLGATSEFRRNGYPEGDHRELPTCYYTGYLKAIADLEELNHAARDGLEKVGDVLLATLVLSAAEKLLHLKLASGLESFGLTMDNVTGYQARMEGKP